MPSSRCYLCDNSTREYSPIIHAFVLGCASEKCVYTRNGKEVWNGTEQTKKIKEREKNER